MNNILEKYFNPSNLRLAYYRVQCWTDKTVKDQVGLRAFGLNLEENCEHLSELIYSGKYEARRGVKFYVPKASMTLRTKTMLFVEDAIVYQAIANKVAETNYKVLNDQESFVFGSVLNKEVTKGVSILDEAEPNYFFFKFWKNLFQKFKESVIHSIEVDKVKYKFETDITGFFDCIPHYNLLVKLSERFGVEDEILDLLSDCFNVWSGTKDSMTPGVGIPQGPLPSFLFANLILHDLDEQIISHGYKYYRYMDDIKIYGYDESELLESLILIDKYLKGNGLSINSKKTKIEKIDASVEDATVKEMKKMVFFGLYDTDEIEMDSLFIEPSKPAINNNKIDKVASELSEQDSTYTGFDSKVVEVLTEESDIINYWEQNIEEASNSLPKLFIDPKAAFNDLELKEGVDDIDVIQLSAQYGTSIYKLKQYNPGLNADDELLKYWLYCYKKYFWRVNNIGLTLVHYKNNKDLKSILLSLIQNEFKLYEWVRFNAIQTLSFSQDFEDKDLRISIFKLLKEEESDLAKISLYRLLFYHSKNEQFLSTLTNQLKKEKNQYLKILITDFKKISRDDEFDIHEFINTIGL